MTISRDTTDTVVEGSVNGLGNGTMNGHANEHANGHAKKGSTSCDITGVVSHNAVDTVNASDGTVSGIDYDEDARFETALKAVQDAWKESHQDGTPQQKAMAKHKLSHATAELKDVAQRPEDFMWSILFWPYWSAGITIATEIGILPAINSRKGTPVSSSTIAHELNYDEDLVVRFMRLLTSVGVTQEVSPCTYKSNQRSEFMSTPDMVGGLKFKVQMMFRISASSPAYMKTAGLRQGSGAPKFDPCTNTFGLPLFEYMKSNPEAHGAFDAFMQGRRKLFPAQWFDVYPAERLFPANSEEVAVVDVGGGRGQDLLTLRKAYPDQKGRLIVQDLPATIESIEKKELASVGVEPMVHNMFDEQPIKGARAYFLHSILHSWRDEPCRLTLINLARAMSSESRILLDDVVLKDTGAWYATAVHDLIQLEVAGSKERTEQQWRELIASVEPPLEIVKIWGQDSIHCESHIIEVKLKG